MPDVTDLIGTPFVYGARGPDEFDCWGIVMEAARRDGKVIPDFGAHVDEFDKETVSSAFSNSLWAWEEKDQPEPGLVVMLNFPHPAWATHCGYMLDRDQFIHSRTSVGVCLGRLSSPVWNKRIAGIYRYVTARDGLCATPAQRCAGAMNRKVKLCR